MTTFLKNHWLLLIAMAIFFSFGLFHLAKFETTDEHFWKYDRVPSYFQSMKHGFATGDFSGTRINDKPGVSTAIISGLGLPFTGMHHPDDHRDRDRDALYPSPETKKDGSQKSLHTFYHTEQTEQLNFALRLPILLVSLFSLPVMYWLLLRVFSRRTAGLTVLLIGANPILIGMSQIINPDALLWTTVTLTIFSYLALLTTKEKKFLILTGLFFGAALLSKYTANILFIILPLIWGLFTHFALEEKLSKESLKKYVQEFLSITGIAFLMFAAFLPAVFENVRHFLYGTIYSPTLRPLVDGVINILGAENYFADGNTYATFPTAVFAALIILILIFAIPKVVGTLAETKPRILRFLFQIPVALLFLIIVVSLVNAWTDAIFFSLENLKETSRHKGDVSFPQFAGDPLAWFKILAAQSQNLLFSLHPILFAGLTGGLIMLLRTPFWKTAKRPRYEFLVWVIVAVLFMFIVGGTLANVFVNVRYSIILYPLIALLTALIIDTHFETFMNCFNKLKGDAAIWVYGVLIILLLCSLWLTKPHYFTYTSVLLPEKHYVGDAWGLGMYEAAQYLNNLPNAENLVVWSDHNGLRQWFTGRTITTPNIYLNHTDIHYIIQTRRGSVLTKPAARTDNPDKQHITFSQYYTPEANPTWQLEIGNRPGNFVKIFKVRQ